MIDGRDGFVGKEEVKGNVKAVEIGKLKMDGKSQAQGAHGEVVVNMRRATEKALHWRRRGVAAITLMERSPDAQLDEEVLMLLMQL